ncbi:glycogen synthase [Streptomyces sp. S1D4-11]|nr:glycogen/starch synthase [Streptomyces sp. S1D4-11]QIY98686.1 glycogen synthase [Streptomyces sp. S1D4-11]
MRCLYLCQELAPYFVEGGLGQAARALPELLHRHHDLDHTLLIPYYPRLVDRQGLRTETVARLSAMTVGGAATVERLVDHDGSCEVFLLRSDRWYDREGIYRDGRYVEFPDAAARAAFYGSAAAQWVRGSGRSYDLVHGNDWQSGPALAHLRHLRGRGGRPALLMNVHNGEYRGDVSPRQAAQLGLPDEFTARLLDKAQGSPSLLLTGLLAADAATTGSPGYARELAEAFAGTALGDALGPLRMEGIVAGVDRKVWDPASPGPLTVPYDGREVTDGKRANKRLLQRRTGLGADPRIPLFAVCARLVPDKGIDLVFAALGPLLTSGRAQLAVVGTGDAEYLKVLADLQDRAPRAVHHTPRFDQELASLVYAGADFTLMPSRVEPCGLNQLIAMAYGTIPLVSAVGGLRDTVTDLRDDPAEGTGFRFAALTSDAVGHTVDHAVRWLAEHPGEVERTRRRAMSHDWSWERTARQTARLYERVVAGG